MILEVVAPTELLAVASAVIVQTLPVASGDLVDGFFVSLPVVWRCEPFGSGARRKSAVVDLHVFLLVAPEAG